MMSCTWVIASHVGPGCTLITLATLRDGLFLGQEDHLISPFLDIHIYSLAIWWACPGAGCWRAGPVAGCLWAAGLRFCMNWCSTSSSSKLKSLSDCEFSEIWSSHSKTSSSTSSWEASLSSTINYKALSADMHIWSFGHLDHLWKRKRTGKAIFIVLSH